MPMVKRPDFEALDAHYKVTTQGRWWANGHPWRDDTPELVANVLFITGVHNEMPHILAYVFALEAELAALRVAPVDADYVAATHNDALKGGV